MTLGRVVLSMAVLLGGAPVLAHAEYESSDPPRNAVLEEMPEEVGLVFTEPVETRFSIFKVYPLEHESLDADALADPGFLRLNGLAAALVSDVLTVRGDEERRVDAGLVAGEDRRREIGILLEPESPPGAYVVMWRALAVDGHTTQGYFVFVVGPDPAGE